MKIQLLSDLHLEFCHYELPFQLDTSLADVLILAGDIGVGVKAAWWISSIAKEYEKVFYIAGNHEFYDNEYYDVLRRLKEFNWPENVHFLHDSAVEYGGFKFVGTTLWTDLSGPNTSYAAKRSMNDYRIITIGNNDIPLHPQDTTAMHKQAVKFLEENVDTETVVISHHLPTPLSVNKKYVGDILNAAYMTDLSSLIEKTNPILWVHGHTHDSCVYEIYNTVVACNPYGYDGYATNPDFNKDLVLEI